MRCCLDGGSGKTWDIGRQRSRGTSPRYRGHRRRHRPSHMAGAGSLPCSRIPRSHLPGHRRTPHWARRRRCRSCTCRWRCRCRRPHKRSPTPRTGTWPLIPTRRPGESSRHFVGTKCRVGLACRDGTTRQKSVGTSAGGAQQQLGRGRHGRRRSTRPRAGRHQQGFPGRGSQPEPVATRRNTHPP
jgi:hypothetical protein